MGRNRLRKKQLSSDSETDESLSAPKNKRRKQIAESDEQDEMLVEASTSTRNRTSSSTRLSGNTSNRSSTIENLSVRKKIDWENSVLLTLFYSIVWTYYEKRVQSLRKNNVCTFKEFYVSLQHVHRIWAKHQFPCGKQWKWKECGDHCSCSRTCR